jgi:prevent-host-death family protein
MGKAREIHFSKARQNLSALVDEVARTGKPVTILRHGKPAAIIASPDEYRDRVRNKGVWKLAGSIKVKDGVDLDTALNDLSKRQAQAWQASPRIRSSAVNALTATQNGVG